MPGCCNIYHCHTNKIKSSVMDLKTTVISLHKNSRSLKVDKETGPNKRNTLLESNDMESPHIFTHYPKPFISSATFANKEVKQSTCDKKGPN